MNDRKMEECLAYFRERPVYDRLFKKFRDKYASLGHLGGTVKITNLTEQERLHLGGFLQKDFSENKAVTVSAALLDKALKNSRFDGLDWEEILKCYFGQPLHVKKELARKEQQEKENYFARFMELADERGENWLQQVLEDRREGYQILMQQYQQAPKRLAGILKNVLEAIPRLPAFEDRAERLAVFAAAVTGDPHYYDEGTTGERLLTAFISFYFGTEGEGGLSQVEKKAHLLYQAGILKDDLSNYVLAYGLCGEEQDGAVHEGMEGYFKMKEPVHLSLLTLGQLKTVWADDIAKGQVYVVENPSFFSALIEHNPQLAAVCVGGQPRLAALVLLDLLAVRHTLWYAGDFDPEGLMIAQNLKRRYQKKMRFWNYRPDYYERCKSEVVLNETRLRKLDKIEDEELVQIKLAMLEAKRAAYQEKLLDATDLLQEMGNYDND